MIVAAFLLTQLVSTNDLIGAAVILGCLLTAIVIVFVKVVLPWRERGNVRYRNWTKAVIDESLGTWGHESVIARDRKRGRGHYAKSTGVRE